MKLKDEKALQNVVVLADFIKQKKKKQRAEKRQPRVHLSLSCDLTKKTYKKILKIQKKSKELFGDEMESTDDVIFAAIHHLLWSCDKKFAGLRILVVKPAKKKNKYKVLYAW